MLLAGFKVVRLLVLLLSFFLVTGQIKAETVTIATGEYPPWTSKSLPHGGYINQIVTEAFKLSGITVKFDYMPWKRALEATKVGQYHASSFWGEDDRRREDFILSDLIDNIYFVFFYQRNSFEQPFQWKTLSALKNYRIGATRGYTYTQEFWDLTRRNQLRVSLGNNDIDGLNKLIDGSIDLFPLSEYTGKYLLKQNFSVAQAQSIRINPKPISTGKNFILFSKVIEDNHRLANIFNRNLAKLKAENKLKRFKEALF